jgi:hypothetical protein
LILILLRTRVVMCFTVLSPFLRHALAAPHGFEFAVGGLPVQAKQHETQRNSLFFALTTYSCITRTAGFRVPIEGWYSGCYSSCFRHRQRLLPVSGRGSAWLERLVRDQEVGGSNPLAPTNSQEDSPLQAPFTRPVAPASVPAAQHEWPAATMLRAARHSKTGVYCCAVRRYASRRTGYGNKGSIPHGGSLAQWNQAGTNLLPSPAGYGGTPRLSPRSCRG